MFAGQAYKMKVSLICAPAWKNKVPPLALATLQSRLRITGHKTKVEDISKFLELRHPLIFSYIGFIEACHIVTRWYWLRHLLPKFILKDWLTKRSDAFCFSVYQYNFLTSIVLSKIIKANKPHALIVFGGPATSYMRLRSKIESSGFVDSIVVGEGDTAILDILDNNAIQRKPMPADDELLPDFAGMNIDSYDGRLPYSTARGCYNNCAYCFDRKYWVRFRTKTINKICDDLQEYQKIHNVCTFIFADSNMIGSKRRIQLFCDELMRRKMDIIWSGQISPNSIDTAYMNRMKQAGCRSISLGIESGSPKVLKDMRKTLSLNHVGDIIRTAHRVGMHATACFMVGYPSETWKDFRMTMRFVKRNHKYLRHIFCSMTSVLEGTDLYINAKTYGIKNRDSYFWRSRRSCFGSRLIKLLIFNLYVESCKARSHFSVQ